MAWWLGMLSGSVAKRQAASANWLFEAGRYRPVTPLLLAGGRLAPAPLGAARLSLVRAAPAGAWHLAPASGESATGCPRLRPDRPACVRWPQPPAPSSGRTLTRGSDRPGDHDRVCGQR